MCKIKYATVCLVFLIAVNFFVTASLAAFETSGTFWSGTSGFDNSAGLSGTVDWAVYKPNNFPSIYTLLDTDGNSLATPLDEYAYVYQVTGTGSDFIHSFSIGVGGAADVIGTFTGGDVSPVGSFITIPVLDSASAYWGFFSTSVNPDGGIGLGDKSEGLVFFSPNSPTLVTATVVDGGNFYTTSLFPSPTPVPEPSTVTLWAVGMGLMLLVRRLRRR